MPAAALIIAVVSLGLAGVAYWRSGGRHDIARLETGVRQQLGELQAKQTELVDHASESLAAAYERSRIRLRTARARVKRLQESAVEGLEAQLRRAGDQLDNLAHRLEDAARDAGDATIAAARATERGIARRARRMQARVLIIEVKGKARMAEHAARDRDFDRADARLADATDLLAQAQTVLADDNAFDDDLDAIRDALRQAVNAVRSQAEDTRRRIEQVLADADRVVGNLEADEGQAAGTDIQSTVARH
jgi:hypothetical protein